MKNYIVTVDTLTVDGRVYCKAMYPIKARDAEEAASIVHNDYSLRNEPNFRISEVKEETEGKK